MPGDWISVSTTPTRRPSPARSAARLAVVFDFPVPPRYEWIEMICFRVVFSSVGGGSRESRRQPYMAQADGSSFRILRNS